MMKRRRARFLSVAAALAAGALSALAVLPAGLAA